jgi:hypothetical protein
MRYGVVGDVLSDELFSLLTDPPAMRSNLCHVITVARGAVSMEDSVQATFPGKSTSLEELSCLQRPPHGGGHLDGAGGCDRVSVSNNRCCKGCLTLPSCCSLSHWGKPLQAGATAWKIQMSFRTRCAAALSPDEARSLRQDCVCIGCRLS